MGEMLAAYDEQKNAITVTYDLLGCKTSLTSPRHGGKLEREP
jgi:hypothetical protein